MIPLYKLEKLPRLQRLRKTAKFFLFAENRLRMSSEKKAEIFSAAELVFFTEAAELLAKDELFPHEALVEFTRAAEVFGKVLNHYSGNTPHFDADEFLRAVNSVKHLLLTAAGRDQADWDFTAEGRLDAAKRRVFPGMMVFLEDIRSPFNVGAMFRTAESFGVEKIFLSPFCADPRHRRAQRTAMGCVDIVPWERRGFFN
jgi:TrmH family RNA methyltransferase